MREPRTAMTEAKRLVHGFVGALLDNNAPRQRVEDYANNILGLLDAIESEAAQGALDDGKDVREAAAGLLDALDWWTEGASWKWTARSKMGRAVRRLARALQDRGADR